MQDQKFDITGMTCSACSAHVEKSVRKLDGIQAVSVNLLTNSMAVTYDEAALDDGRIIAAVALLSTASRRPLPKMTPSPQLSKPLRK